MGPVPTFFYYGKRKNPKSNELLFDLPPWVRSIRYLEKILYELFLAINIRSELSGPRLKDWLNLPLNLTIRRDPIYYYRHYRQKYVQIHTRSLARPTVTDCLGKPTLEAAEEEDKPNSPPLFRILYLRIRTLGARTIQ